MRILMCAAEAPLAPLNGFRLQIIPVCVELAARGHEVHVVAYRWPGQHGAPPAGVELQTIDLPARRRAGNALRWVANGRPFAAILTTDRMLAAVKEVLAERTFDVAHVAGWSIAGLAPALAPLPAVLTTLDAIHVNYRARSDRLRFPMKPLLRIEAARVGRFEARAYRDYNAVVVVSGEDERSLRRLDPELPVRVIPNGVDADRYSPRPDARREPGLVVFTGAMDWHPNVAAACFLAQEVMPRVLERCPDARLALVGRSPSREVSALAAPGTVEVTGEVPDIGEWLRRAHAYACPMVSGTGIKNKLLEAMACACACVATARACQGLDVRHGRELLVGETADEIAAALADVLEDEQLAARVGSAGREYVLRSHSWSGVADAYERLLREACEGSAAAPSVVT